VPAACKCQSPPFWFEDYDTVEVGEDSHGAEVSLSTCRSCGLVWLEYLIEEPWHSRSGRWWRVLVSPERRSRMSPNDARDFIEQQEAGFVGGSYFDSTGRAVSAPIRIG